MATLNIKCFPEELYKVLKKRAASDRRSLAQEIIFILQRTVEETEKPSILELRGLGKKRWKGIHATKHIHSERESCSISARRTTARTSPIRANAVSGSSAHRWQRTG